MNTELRFARNLGAITRAQQRRLASARILVAGLGGVGGICAELLVRAGVGHLMVIDSDCYDASNLNRQIHAQRKTIGCRKIDVFAEKMQDINPKLELEKIGKRMEYSSLSFFDKKLAAYSPNIIIDTMDSALSRVMLARMCRKQGIPYVYAAAMGERGMVSVLDAKKTGADLERILHLSSLGRLDAEIESSLIHYPQCKSAWGPATNLTGALAANASLNFMLEKMGSYPKAPDFWMVDAFSKKIVRNEKLA